MGTRGEREALNRFLAGVQRRAFRIAEIATHGHEEALDIVQDSMLKLVQRYADRPEEEWAPLFHRILQSRIRDWYRRTAVRRRFRGWLGGGDDDPAGDPIDAVPDPRADDPESGAHRERSLGRLEVALRALSLRQQQAFLLRAWEGMDVAQTARAMRCSQGSVKTHYHRAVRALRERLGDDWR